MSTKTADIAPQLRQDMLDSDRARLLRAATSLYPSRAISPTAAGYWHIRTRQGFVPPHFGRPVSPPDEAPETSDFCALYFARPKGMPGKRDADGELRTVFRGSFADSDYDAVDRTFRVLTDEVLEARWPRLNEARGRRVGRIFGIAIGTGGPIAAAAYVLNGYPDVQSIAMDVLTLVPPGFRTVALLCGGILFLGACCSIMAAIGACVFRRIGRLLEIRRLKRLDALATTFLYGRAAGDAVRREYGMVSQERKKQEEYDRLLAAGIELTPGDFLNVYGVLPYMHQLAMTEKQRREEVDALAEKLGAAFPVSIMRLVEPYLPTA